MLGWILGRPGDVRRLGVGRTRRVISVGGRLYEYLKQFTGPNGLGLSGFFLHLAVDVQRAALDCLRWHLGLRLVGYLWPSLRTVLGDIDWRCHCSVAWMDIIIYSGAPLAMGCCLFAVLLLYRRITSTSAYSRNIYGRACCLTVTWSSGGVTHLIERAPSIFPWRVSPSTRIFHRPRRGAADRRVPTTGVITTSASWCGGVKRPERHPARHRHLHRTGGGDLSADEHQRAGCGSVARP